jgi:hypothetical protein
MLHASRTESGISYISLVLARVYNNTNRPDSAIVFAKTSVQFAEKINDLELLRGGHQVLSNAYAAKKDFKSAYFHNVLFQKYADSIAGKSKAYEIANLQYSSEISLKESKIRLLEKDKQIQQIQLQKESLWRKFLIVGIIAVLLLGLILVRVIMLKRKNEKTRRELAENELQIQTLESERKQDALKQQATELEMQALRAQMNPHFIFNSLNSINRFILQNNKVQASEYLTKFSRVSAHDLQNSQESFITLENELESLQLYVSLEALRFDDHFDYRISVIDDLDTSIVKVPPLIIQPYVENAIWHGLMHKEEKGQLNVTCGKKINSYI